MTAQAHMPQPGLSPSLFNFTALFDRQSSYKPSWKYEPPNLPKTSRPLQTPSEPPYTPSPFFFVDAESPTVRPERIVGAEDAAPDCAAPSLDVEAPRHDTSQKDALDAEIRHIETRALELLNHHVIDNSDMGRLYRAKFERLLLTRRFEDLHNLEALLPNRENIGLMLSSRETALERLSRFIKRDIRNRRIVGKVFDQLSRGFQRRWVDKGLTELLEHRKQSKYPRSTKRLDLWLRTIQRIESAMTGHEYGSHLSFLAYDRLAANSILFRPNSGTTSSKYDAMLRMLLHRIKYDGSAQAIPPGRIQFFIRKYRPVQHTEEFNVIMADLLLGMRREWIANYGIAQIIIEYIYAKGGLRRVLHFLDEIKFTKKKVLSGTAFLDQFLLDLLQRHAVSISTSDAVRLGHRTISLKYLKSGPSRDMLNEYMASIQFRHLLNQARRNHILPLSVQTKSMKELWGARAETIHQIAHQYSLDITRSDTQNARSVYYLYRYLIKNDLSIGDLFTKALVRTFLTRPMLQRKFISARRLIWVCNIVAKVEGEDVARKIEHEFWHWRGDLIAHAKKKLDMLAGPSPNNAHVNTMNRLGLL